MRCCLLASGIGEPQLSLRPLLDLTSLCELLGISLMSGNRLLRSGALPAYRVGGQWRFDEAEVRDALRAGAGDRFVRGHKRHAARKTETAVDGAPR